MACPEAFPLDELARASTLDGAQARALRAALTEEVALLQGPPGTGARAPPFAPRAERQGLARAHTACGSLGAWRQTACSAAIPPSLDGLVHGWSFL
jgi:hypothetical protein